MAAPDIHSHESPIRTPKQLVIVVVLAFLVPIIIVALLAGLATSGLHHEPETVSPEVVAERIKPVASVAVSEGGASEAKGARSGEQVVQSTCGACHTSGAAGAPKIGDKGAWGPRIAAGQKHLFESALKGVRAMPARGGNPDLTDVEVERAVVFMANQSGASFKEPAAAAAKTASSKK